MGMLSRRYNRACAGCRRSRSRILESAAVVEDGLPPYLRGMMAHHRCGPSATRAAPSAAIVREADHSFTAFAVDRAAHNCK